MLDSSDAALSFEVRADARTYPVAIEPGAAEAHLRALGGDAVVICDAIFADRFADLPCPVLSLPAEEARKTLDEGGRLVAEARALGLTRRGRITAVGGGIVQDVACFVASVYMRGVAWEYLPTTVLAMADSCIGGKSSLNVGRFKNLAGTIHPPDAVLVDPLFADTLAPEHRAGGLCEAAKIAFARGPEPFGRLLALRPDAATAGAGLAAALAISLAAKRWFIEADEFDQRERLLLNFGHTFGHALESASGFAINHGAAVGLGMLCAIDFAERRGVAGAAGLDRLRDLTLRLLAGVPGLAGHLAAVDMGVFEQAFLSDKKHRADALTLVLPAPADGLPLSLCRVPRSEAALAAVCAAVERVRGAVR